MKLALTILFTTLLIVGCGEKKVEQKATETKVEIPKVLFDIDLKAGIPVLEARTHKAGDKVTVSGKIMGSPSPFVDGRASFIIGDPKKLTSCDLNEDDPCEKPWDVCCEDTKDIAAETLNIQVTDENGKVLKTGLKGINGLKELSEVIIEGTVAANSSADAMTINASAIKIVK